MLRAPVTITRVGTVGAHGFFPRVSTGTRGPKSGTVVTSTYEEAISSPQAARWIIDMDKDVERLHENRTWKSLYGLKQAPFLWFEKLTSFLNNKGVKPSDQGTDGSR